MLDMKVGGGVLPETILKTEIASNNLTHSQIIVSQLNIFH